MTFTIQRDGGQFLAYGSDPFNRDIRDVSSVFACIKGYRGAGHYEATFVYTPDDAPDQPIRLITHGNGWLGPAVVISYIHRGARNGWDAALTAISVGDRSRLRDDDFVRLEGTPDAVPLIGAHVQPEPAIEAIKQFLDDPAALPDALEWIDAEDLPEWPAP